MALFIDGPPSSIEDLSAQDSQLLDVATVEGIDVTQKLELAHEEIGIELYSLLNRMRPAGFLLWISVKPNLTGVVLTPPLKQWHTYRALEMFYADAYNSQLNDRYAGKRDQFHELAKKAYDKVIEAGVGMVLSPVPRPETPALSPTAGSLPDNLYYVTTTWVNRGNEESAPARPSSIMTSASTFLVQAGEAPSGVTGWNVYAGTDLKSLRLQNEVELSPGDTWVQPDTMATTGRRAGHGQPQDYHQPVPRMLQRG
jgi:hypothetical protein